MGDECKELPEDCWEIVFRHLTQPSQWASVSLACKQFLFMSNRLRPSIKISSTSLGMIHGGLPRILRRFYGLQEIDLHKFHGNLARPLADIARSGLQLRALSIQGQMALPTEAIIQLGKSCENSLRSLNCSRIHLLRDEDLATIAEAFPNLEQLDISYTAALRPLHDVSITDAGIEALAGQLQCLKILNVSGNYFLSDAALFALSWGCRHLQELILFDCPLISDIGLEMIASQCPQLTSLAVNGGRISQSAIKSFASTTSLQCLDLSLLHISDELLLSLAELKLTRLILARCKGMTLAGILGLSRLCPNLVHLNLEGAHCLTDEIMEVIVQRLPNLTYLCLNYCSLLTDSTFFCLLKNCKNLVELEMESTGLGWGMNSSMAPGQKCCKLQSLKIAWNKPVGDVTLKCIAILCPRLVSLDVSHCLLVTDNGLRAISKGCLELKKLVLKGCRQVMSLGIEGFEGFRNLEQLQVEGSGFTDPGLMGVGRSCRCLLRLGLEGCSRVTESGLKKVMEDCRLLRRVNLKDCKCVNVDALAWMVFYRPSLRKLVPPSSCVSEGQKALLSRHGCEVFRL
ncbi:uncharacterized protein LOC131077147 isoform X2 [Cryptomeria japonica]|uniref:uncharacterized protein LOC131077147 isoform X2 n=1 Tax=Cryptomeria japonica TaxID=3369 RepID=UPI0025ACB442|nr:uncharacterized protein LOC131077147 isoform X2 [Cryptomeria japonica]